MSCPFGAADQKVLGQVAGVMTEAMNSFNTDLHGKKFAQVKRTKDVRNVTGGRLLGTPVFDY
jgi:hypothetical protein